MHLRDIVTKDLAHAEHASFATELWPEFRFHVSGPKS